ILDILKKFRTNKIELLYGEIKRFSKSQFNYNEGVALSDQIEDVDDNDESGDLGHFIIIGKFGYTKIKIEMENNLTLKTSLRFNFLKSAHSIRDLHHMGSTKQATTS
ncbi:hypothetical protein ACJX0J_030611, partial [Zea mays]